jgi:hypothetical protein
MARAFRLRFERDHRLVFACSAQFCLGLIAISMMDLAAKS